MIKQVYRLRLPAISMVWMYEVAETPQDAVKQVEREFEGKLAFRGDSSEWEVEPCSMDELARVCKHYRVLWRKINDLETALRSKQIVIESRKKTINDLAGKLISIKDKSID